jgi:hypothetical protein
MSSPNQGGEGVGGESSPSADESFHGGVTIPFQKVSSAGHAAPNGVAPLEAGQRFGEFEIIAMLGKGGMGAVYKALQVRCGGEYRTMALGALRWLASRTEHIPISTVTRNAASTRAPR